MTTFLGRTLCSDFASRANNRIRSLVTVWKCNSVWKPYLTLKLDIHHRPRSTFCFDNIYQSVSAIRSISTSSRNYKICDCYKQSQAMEQGGLTATNNTEMCKDSVSVNQNFNVPASDKTSSKEKMAGEDKPPNSLSKRAQKKMARAQKHREMRKQKKEESQKQIQVKDAGFGVEEFNQSSYYFENGLRKVYPYSFVFATYAKGRWVGRTIQDVLLKEFGFDHPDDLQKSFDNGKIHVNDCQVTSDYVLKDCDFISHQTHRHENPVTSAPLAILEDNDDVLVINKPSSIPCHPCGRYRFNSVAFILGKDMGYTNLRNIYRLDRLTSGVLILAKTMERTKLLMDQVAKRQVQKEYVCRVIGKFPDGTLKVDQPLQALSNKLRLQVVSPTGKSSQTTFTRLSFNGKTSVVKCIPHTGRTHQIRVHLQYLGHPIVNDMFYNNIAWGPNKAKDGVYEVPHDKVCERILAEHHVALWDGGPNPLYQEKLQEMKIQKAQTNNFPDTAKQPLNLSDTDNESTENEKKLEPSDTHVNADSFEQSQISGEPLHKRRKKDELNETTSSTSVEKQTRDGSLTHFEMAKWSIDESCEMCKKKCIDPEEKDLVMFLHALKYQVGFNGVLAGCRLYYASMVITATDLLWTEGPGWSYETDLPDWAREDWDKDSDYMRTEWNSLRPEEESSLS